MKLCSPQVVSFAGLAAGIARDALFGAGGASPAIPAQVHQTLETIASELRTISNPGLLGQIATIKRSGHELGGYREDGASN